LLHPHAWVTFCSPQENVKRIKTALGNESVLCVFCANTAALDGSCELIKPNHPTVELDEDRLLAYHCMFHISAGDTPGSIFHKMNCQRVQEPIVKEGRDPRLLYALDVRFYG